MLCPRLLLVFVIGSVSLLAGPDKTPPLISGLSAGTPSATGATITWITDEPATSEVEYGPTTAYGSTLSLGAKKRGTNHSITLAALLPNTTYHFRAISRDQSGNRAVSPDSTFATAVPADAVPPVISAVSAGTPAADNATIQWATDERATTQVEFGTTEAYGAATALDASLVTSHSALLAGLSPGMTYHFRVLSKDGAGNTAASADATFVTAAATAKSGGVLDYGSPFCQNGIPAPGYPWACGAWPSTTPPVLKPAGGATADPDTGNRVLRVTAPGSHSQTTTASFFTNYSGWNHDWAADDSAVIVRTWGGDGGKFWVGFDPATMTLTGASGRIPDAFAGDNYAFDETDPDLIIGVQGSSIRTWNRKTLATTTLFPLTAVTSVHSLTAKGTRVCVNNGPQDGGYIIECFDRAAGTKQVIDLHRQTINDQPYTVWYKGGTTNHTGAGIHAITLGADGRWLATDLKSTPGCSALGLGTYSNQGAFFDLQTGQAYAWSVACGQTHWAIGYAGFAAHGASAQWTADGFMQAGACPSDDDRGIVTRTAGIDIDSSLGQLSCPPRPAMYGVGTHFSWQNNRDDANRNTYPVVGASLRNANGNAYLFNDVFAVQVAQAAKSNKVWRFAQTWNDQKTANCDFLGWTSPTVSRSGKFVAFPSNWMGQTGSGACTYGKRVDVFVFELK